MVKSAFVPLFIVSLIALAADASGAVSTKGRRDETHEKSRLLCFRIKFARTHPLHLSSSYFTEPLQALELTDTNEKPQERHHRFARKMKSKSRSKSAKCKSSKVTKKKKSKSATDSDCEEQPTEIVFPGT